ncbi:MAG: multicopper oxidase domain-containing protein [Chloroflexi bacterium]|uniref:Multicopper oxidase domain-containing protein n=1 Tax=Candidatus Chlorohelix allophototropha TaxID=3003348 RepID=A0A8T7LVI1_9CHLR|nr:multicopper oxidase domain-containing protein [Chloroflexota bacterium]WJW67888.1 multicopper oxidase domain-containing protein [Chloroflexota bacterium L227-S17]
MRLAQNKINLKRVSLGLVLLMVAMLVATVPTGSAEVKAATTPPKTGLICTTGTSPNPTFSLTAQSGYITLPDGNISFMWSYAPTGGTFQLPGPFLCVNEGDLVTIVLNNKLPEDTSIVIPGMEGVMANGVAAQPQFDTTNTLTSLTNVAKANGGSITYTFTAGMPGTYLYESGTDEGKQVNMGLFGALIVRPKATGLPVIPGTAYAYNRADSIYNAGNEYVMITSELDPALHQAVENGQAYDITQNHPRYWMINGRSFPDTIADNGAAWLTTQPYGAMVHMQPYDPSATSAYHYPAMVHYLNVGMLNHPFHPHGNHGRVIGRDARPLASPAGDDLSYEKFLILLGSGQTWDVLYQWSDEYHWNAATNPIPVTVPQLQNLTFKGGITWYSGSPYLGVQDGLPTGTTSYNQCGEYYQVWHSHALNEAANYDLGFGGMFTLQRIDPPMAQQVSNNRLCN